MEETGNSEAPAEGWVFPSSRSGEGHVAGVGHFHNDITDAAGAKFWFHGLRNAFITVAERELMLPRSLTKRLVNHARPSDVTEGYAADWTVEQLREAGPCPEPAAPLELDRRWWLVEIEQPADDEPNALALWEEDGAEVSLAAFLDVDAGGGVPFVTMVSWRTAPDGERSRAGVAVLKYPVHVDDPASPES